MPTTLFYWQKRSKICKNHLKCCMSIGNENKLAVNLNKTKINVFSHGIVKKLPKIQYCSREG